MYEKNIQKKLNKAKMLRCRLDQNCLVRYVLLTVQGEETLSIAQNAQNESSIFVEKDFIIMAADAADVLFLLNHHDKYDIF